MCENCSLLIETWYYGKLHKNTENELGYYYNVSKERIVEKSGGVGIGASLTGPSVEASLGASVVTTNGCPQILMFHHNDSDHCYSCFKEIYPSIYHGASLSLEHTANIRERDGSQDNEEDAGEEEDNDNDDEEEEEEGDEEDEEEDFEDLKDETFKDDEEPEINIERYDHYKTKEVAEVWKEYNGYSKKKGDEEEKEPVEEEKEAAQEKCSDGEENEKEVETVSSGNEED